MRGVGKKKLFTGGLALFVVIAILTLLITRVHSEDMQHAIDYAR